MPLEPQKLHRGLLELTTGGVVAIACALFDQVWQTAEPCGEDTPLISDELSPSERQLLELLSAGHTDEAAARRLGVSLSTVRRLMSTLMNRLGARSRFQAGAMAAERGWLSIQNVATPGDFLRSGSHSRSNLRS